MVEHRGPIITASAKIWLDDEGVVHLEPRARRQQELRDAQENVAAVALAGAGERRPLLIHFQQAAPQTAECREHYLSAEAARAVSAVAIVTASMLGRVIGNLMLGKNEHHIPIRLFDTPVAARAWLLDDPEASADASREALPRSTRR